jgi:hypothetical protein
MQPPPGNWHSPFSNRSLNAEELIRESALNVVSKVLMLRLFSDARPSVALAPNGLSITAPGTHFKAVIPFPPELGDYFQSDWTIWFSTFFDEYGLGSINDLMPEKIPEGEKIGRLFRHFRVLQQLYQIGSQLGWPQDRILGIHGAESPEVFGRLRAASIPYMLVWREEHIAESAKAGREITPEMMVDCLGSGCMKALSLADAETLARDAFAKKSESTRRIFTLNYAYCVDSWSSNHPRFL